MGFWFEIVVCALLLSISISTYSIYSNMKNDFISNQIWNELKKIQSFNVIKFWCPVRYNEDQVKDLF